MANETVVRTRRAGTNRIYFYHPEVVALRNRLETDDESLVRALMTLTNRQTVPEKRQKDAQVRNFAGFNKGDAHSLTGVGLRAMGRKAHVATLRETLSTEELQLVRERVPKYALQLVRSGYVAA